MRLIGATDSALKNREDMKRRIGLKTVAELLMLSPIMGGPKDKKDDKQEVAMQPTTTDAQNFKETEQKFLSERKASTISIDCGSEGGEKCVNEQNSLSPHPPKATFTGFLRKGARAPRRREWKIGTWKMAASFPAPSPVKIRRPKTTENEPVRLRRTTSAHRTKQDQLDYWCQ
eukprot:TRINITY_DN6943_c1_g1_i2.p1 TRINITY_DN6943_c1_g1~~TRINITY_DN6943_c1_g1_i2.p1  ORF type:complete len:173 (+),score=17.69 TRINITY_DN6943_c1_g1_i2:153-671(+)